MSYQRVTLVLLLLAMIALHANDDLFGQRGGGAFRGGGTPHRGGSVGGPYGGGGATVGNRGAGAVIGPGGKTGRVNTGSKSGSYVTPGGGTINYKGAGGKVTGPGGGSAGRVIGGVEVTGPGGKSATKAGAAGGLVGPGGKAVGGKSSVGVISGPGGKAGAISKGGAALGPGGFVAGKSGAVVGPHGGFGAYRGVSTGRSTRYVAAATARGQAVYVRNGFAHYNCFRPNWYIAHPNAWRAAAWTTAIFWTGVSWGSVSSACGYPPQPIIYDYGSTIVYEDNRVFYNGEPVATAEEYAQQATLIAQEGQEAKVSGQEEWTSLGVFGMIQGEEKDANNVFQLAINKDGILRGNFYSGLTDTTAPVFGSVDKRTQRAAWTVGDRKEPIYETGIGNLTEPQTQMLVHFDKDRTQQWTLVRMDPPSDVQ